MICGLLRINDAIEMHFPSKRLETFGSILNGKFFPRMPSCTKGSIHAEGALPVPKAVLW